MMRDLVGVGASPDYLDQGRFWSVLALSEREVPV